MPPGEENKPLEQPLGNVEGSPETRTGTFLGVPLRGWAIVAISAIAVAYTAGWGGISLYQKYKAQVQKTDTLQQKVDATTQLTTQRITEAEKHKKAKDPFKPIPIDSSAGHLVTAEYYPSDGCIHVIRNNGGTGPYGISEEQDLWIPDPSRVGSIQAEMKKPAARDEEAERVAELATRRAEAQRRARLQMVSLDAVDFEQFSDRPPALKEVQVGCLNPHPWGFRSWWGPANGCIAPFYRQWNDGCTHYQVYNACTGYWDPNVYWTFCAPQHHP